jgi:sarcosine oxidase gamma subunit
MASAPGVCIRPLAVPRIAVLRYFDRTDAFVRGLEERVGPLPDPQHAVRRVAGAAGSEIILACRNPTETLALCGDDARFEALERFAEGRDDGCLIEQTRGLWAASVSGARRVELLARLGSSELVPAVGRAHTGRLAELAVTTLCVQAGEFILLVERVYADHLRGWMRESIADFAPLTASDARG